jgi:RecA-family ATPase
MPFTKRYDELFAALEGADLGIVDNVSEAFMANENNRQQVVQFVRGMKRIAMHHDLALMLLAHIDKAAARYGALGNSFSGSTAWHNSTRSRLALLSGEKLKLAHEKHNYSPEAEVEYLEFRDGTIWMITDEVDADDAQEVDDDAAEVLQAMRDMTEMGQPIPAAQSGPDSIFKALKPYLSKLDNSRVVRAIQLLIRNHSIREEEMQVRSNRFKKVYTLVE